MRYIIRSTSKGIVRDEIIDTETNVLFKNAKNAEDVKNAYEAFWDLFLDKHEPKVTVLGVLPLDYKIKRFSGDAIVSVKSHERRV